MFTMAPRCGSLVHVYRVPLPDTRTKSFGSSLDATDAFFGRLDALTVPLSTLCIVIII